MSPPPAPDRHLLLIATQSDAAEQKLTRLETAAEDLFRVLTDPAIGACTPSPAADHAHLRSGSVRSDEIEDAVKAAVRAAGDARATLVIAMLGHGQSPQSGGRLLYMASDSEDGRADRSVDVAALLSLASDHDGVAGVIALLDTCHAGAALPDTAALAGGFGAGRKRLAVLMACGAQQRAYDLDFSRSLGSTLAQGLSGSGAFLRPADVKLAIAPELRKQDVRSFEYDGESDAAGPLWLALNTGRGASPQAPAASSAGGVGPTGVTDLARALATWPGAPATPSVWTRPALLDLVRRATETDDPAGRWAAEVAEGVLAAMDTGSLIVELAGSALTTPLLRGLAAAFNRQWGHRLAEPVRPPASLTGRPLLQHLLEHAALRTPTTDADTTHRALAWYVVAAAEECGFDTGDDRVARWSGRLGAEIALNDARSTHAERGAGERARRLVISLHAARVDWPDSLSVCLRSGPDCTHHETFPCEPDRAGVEQALPAVISWAERLLPPGERVRDIDLVAPAPVLLDWRPEQAAVGLRLLGVTRTVTLRWAGRLVVPHHLDGINEFAREQLEKLGREELDQDAPVDWVDPADVTPDRLGRHLAAGRYQRAVGIAGRPAAPRLRELLALFLPYTPILIWPDTDGKHADPGRACLHRLWETLPDGFGEAYRRRWLDDGDTGEETDPHLDRLADLRTAWHDTDWLDFCGRYPQHTVTAAPPRPLAPPAPPAAPRST
ncbi:hypothetical protein [Kitasatospora sp. NPDC051705]|uniref:vWA-MoxR associated conflict system protein n=1 Tax=Kitasatospora sp. NPDC051705 TaxID=3364057 RepID=UPI00379A2B0E